MTRCIACLLVLAGAVPAHAQPNRTEVTALVFLPDGKTVIAASLDDKLHQLELATGKEMASWDAHTAGCWTAVLSPDGKILASGGGDNKIRFWDAKSLKETRVFEGHTKDVLALAYSPDGKTLASGSADRTIRIWDLATGKELRKWHAHEFKVLSLSFSADGKLLASGGTCTANIPNFVMGATHADQVRLWDPETGNEVRKHKLQGLSVQFAPDGRTLIASGPVVTGQQRDGGGVMVRGGTTAALATPFKDTEIYDLKQLGGLSVFSPDGRMIAVGLGSRLHGGRFNYMNDSSRKVTLIDVATGKELMVLPHDDATAMAFSPDGRKLAIGFAYTPVQFVDLKPANWEHGEQAPKLAAADLDKLWTQLADADPAVAYLAMWTLSAAGEPAVAFLKDRLRPEKLPENLVAELLAKLDSDKYAVREAAFRDLKKLGPAAEGELRKALAAKLSPEVGKRVQKLLDSWDNRPSGPDETRVARAFQVLERLATADARATLARLAEGTPGAWQTEQARLALARLRLRS